MYFKYKVNTKVQILNSKSQITKRRILQFGACVLGFIWNFVLEIWNF